MVYFSTKAAIDEVVSLTVKREKWGGGGGLLCSSRGTKKLVDCIYKLNQIVPWPLKKKQLVFCRLTGFQSIRWTYKCVTNSLAKRVKVESKFAERFVMLFEDRSLKKKIDCNDLQITQNTE